MGRIFIGQFVSDEESLLDKRISQAGNNYQLKFIKIVKPDISISIVPIFFNSQLVVNKESNVIKLKSNIKNNIINTLITNIKAFFLVKKNKKIENIWIYNITVSTILTTILLTLFSNKKIYYIVADYHNLNFFIQKLTKILLSLSNGCIILSTNVKTKLKCKVEMLPGIIESNEINISKAIKTNNILFSGSLGRTTGFELALKMAKQTKDINLYVTGIPYGYTSFEFQNILKLFKSENIFYLGLLNYTDYKKVISKCSIALSLRDPNDIQHNFNFPSKILEYMSKGIVVISTKMYNEINNDSYFFSSFSVNGLIKVTKKILKNKNLTDYRVNLNQYVYNNFTEKNLISKIEKLENNKND